MDIWSLQQDSMEWEKLTLIPIPFDGEECEIN